MMRGLIIAAAMTAGGLAFSASGANAVPVSTGPASGLALPQMSLVEKTQHRYCRRWYRECRARWGGGRDFRRCMRRHGCD